MRQIKESISKAGYSISVGYAMKASDQSLEDTLRESDEKMYKEKVIFYQESGRDRRSRRREDR